MYEENFEVWSQSSLICELSSQDVQRAGKYFLLEEN